MNLYRSQLILNSRCPQVQADLGRPQDLHRTLTLAWAGEPGASPQTGRVLWRLDSERPPVLLVHSRTLPNWERLNRRHPDYLCASHTAPLDEARLAALSRPGGRCAFRLRASPGVGRAARAGWLAAQGERHGFHPERFEISGGGRLPNCQGEARPLRVVSFEGVLRITDPARLRQALAEGLGDGQSLGLGLLSLAPPY